MDSSRRDGKKREKGINNEIGLRERNIRNKEPTIKD